MYECYSFHVWYKLPWKTLDTGYRMRDNHGVGTVPTRRANSGDTKGTAQMPRHETPLPADLTASLAADARVWTPMEQACAAFASFMADARSLRAQLEGVSLLSESADSIWSCFTGTLANALHAFEVRGLAVPAAMAREVLAVRSSYRPETFWGMVQDEIIAREIKRES